MGKEGFVPQYVVEGTPRNRHFKLRQGNGSIDLRHSRSSMVAAGNNGIADPLAMPLDSLPLDASGFPHVESSCVQELDVTSVAQAKKYRTTKPRQKVHDTGRKSSITDGLAFSRTAAELEEEGRAAEPKKKLIHRRTISRSQLILLQTVFHSPEQLEARPPVRTAKIGLVEGMIRANGGDPDHRSPKNISKGGNVYRYKSFPLGV